MALLAPLFLLGLAALAVPVLLHLSQRARREPVRFPSLTFVRQVPFKTTERRRLRDRLLLLLRALALALLVVAFARPFLERASLGVADAARAREIVILLDRSASMGYGDRWARARDAVRRVTGSLGPEDRVTLVAFDVVPTALGPPSGDAVQLDAYLDGVEPHGGGTRYAPAISLARDLIEQSTRPRRTVVLVTDFQQAGWDGRTDVRLPAGTEFEPVPVGEAGAQNLAVVEVLRQRTADGGGRVTLSARVANLGPADAEVTVRLGIEEQVLHEQPAAVAAGEASLVRFPEIALPASPTGAWVTITADGLPVDDTYRFVLRPISRIRVLVVESAGASERERLYLRRALALGRDPAFVTTLRTAPTAADVRAADVVVLNDAPFPGGDAGRALTTLLDEGGGLLWALGSRVRTIPAAVTNRLGRIEGAPVDRLSARGAVVGVADYGHPIFAPYRDSRGADFAAVHVYRYRRVSVPDSARVLAWADDGSPMLTEARVGRGRVLLWSADFGNVWSDLAVRAAFLPTVHESVRYLAHHQEPPAAYAVGQTVELDEAGGDTAERVLEGPDGSRTPLPLGEVDPIRLERAGFYSVRPLAGGTGIPVAANLDPTESDLAVLDETALTVAVAGDVEQTGTADGGLTLTALERERRQRLWWYLAAAALALLGVESALAGVRPRGMGA